MDEKSDSPDADSPHTEATPFESDKLHMDPGITKSLNSENLGETHDSSEGREIAIAEDLQSSLGIISSQDVGVEPTEIRAPPSVTTSAPFVHSLGAWSKPLKFTPPATPPGPSTPRNYDPLMVASQIEAFWPSVTESLDHTQRKKKVPTPILSTMNLPVTKLPPPELKEDGTLRFPWAARMDPSTRNLYRAATPTYRIDGTPEVIIPSKVMELGPEHKGEYVIGQFHRCFAPPGGLVHAVLNRLWGRSCRISCRKMGDSAVLIHIPHQETRKWVIQRGVWHVDDCLLFVAPWASLGSFKFPEISSIPVWVNLRNVPGCCFSRLGISHVASGLGEPMLTHKPRLDPLSLGEAKILVEVELDKPFPKKIALDDKHGNIYLVDVEYTWIPTACGRCGNLGHKEKWCLLPSTVEKTAGVSQEKVQKDSMEVQPEGFDKPRQCNPPENIILESHPVEIKEQELLGSQDANIETAFVLEDQRQEQNITERQDKLHTIDVSNLHEEEEFTHQINQMFASSSHLSVTPKVTHATTNAPTFSTTSLVGTSPTPAIENIMESSPSTIITGSHHPDDRLLVTPPFNMSTFSTASSFEMHAANMGVGVGEYGSFTVTRGGRQTRPTQKNSRLGVDISSW